MFGYVVMNRPEMKIKDYDLYRSFYCGLCRELRDRYGISGQITLTYDLTFVTLLLSGLYEPPTKKAPAAALSIRYAGSLCEKMSSQNMRQI